MTAVQSALRPAFVRLFLALAIAVSVGGATQLVSAPSAHAAFSAAKGQKVVKVAATRKGASYRWGAIGPRRFDCSGLVKWSFKRVGKNLPRTSRAQYSHTKRISKSQRRAGDLVFFLRHGRVYHVGIYAGGGRMWHAPKPGDHVKLAKIYSSSVRYGRVR
jgi:cell wall-associated NlpC family hydrolase